MRSSEEQSGHGVEDSEKKNMETGLSNQKNMLMGDSSLLKGQLELIMVMMLESRSKQERDSQLNRVFLTVANHLDDMVKVHEAGQRSQ